jgi:monofunctional biosynthetic peptidoglycan transglycosylase
MAIHSDNGGKVDPEPQLPSPARTAQPPKTRRRLILRRAAIVAAALFGLFLFSLLLLKWIDPPFTALHVQRRIESWFDKGPYAKHYQFIPLGSISPHLQHAVIAAEDGRFYQHHGFDWIEIKDAVTDDWEEGRFRGASTISQQLFKNLYFGTRLSPIRKAFELALVPFLELVLGKDRILELYLNTIEMGRGVYGADAAARVHFHTTAARLSREQAARLAAILPAPRRRNPARMNTYSRTILTRMAQMGW